MEIPSGDSERDTRRPATDSSQLCTPGDPSIPHSTCYLISTSGSRWGPRCRPVWAGRPGPPGRPSGPSSPTPGPPPPRSPVSRRGRAGSTPGNKSQSDHHPPSRPAPPSPSDQGSAAPGEPEGGPGPGKRRVPTETLDRAFPSHALRPSSLPPGPEGARVASARPGGHRGARRQDPGWAGGACRGEGTSAGSGRPGSRPVLGISRPSSAKGTSHACPPGASLATTDPLTIP